MGNSKLMVPLFYGGNFNREGRRMQAVLEKEISDGKKTIGFGALRGNRIWTIPRQRMINTSSMWRSMAILPLSV